MVTFFTTVKEFKGKTLVNQVNAIKSWLIGNAYECEAIIFGPDSGLQLLEDLPEVTWETRISSNESGVPFINAMFYRASALAKNDILCFLNADIIVHETFIEDILRIHKKLKQKYLIVGERLDSDFDYLIDFSHRDWYKKLMIAESKNFKEHLPYGSDFFVFPKGQYSPEEFVLPDMLVGRPGWDNYMIYDARKNNIRLVNLTPSTKVIHQSHDYYHKNIKESIRKKEDKYNYQFLPENEIYSYVLIFCNYKFVNKKIKKTYHDNNLHLYYLYECLWGNPGILKKMILKFEIFYVSKRRHTFA